jgi:hypothetical protein
LKGLISNMSINTRFEGQNERPVGRLVPDMMVLSRRDTSYTPRDYRGASVFQPQYRAILETLTETSPEAYGEVSNLTAVMPQQHIRNSAGFYRSQINPRGQVTMIREYLHRTSSTLISSFPSQRNGA